MRLVNPAYAPQQANINDKPQMSTSFNPAFHQQQVSAPQMSASQTPTDLNALIGMAKGHQPSAPVPVDQRQGGGGMFNVLGTIGSIAGALSNASAIGDLGHTIQEDLHSMGNQLNTGSQFQGYGITSGLGATTVGADGGISFGVGPDASHQAAGNTNMTGAGNAFTAALDQGSGQSNVDWNSIGQGQLGASQGVNPSTGAFGDAGQRLYNNALGMNPNQGWAGANAQDAAARSMADPSQRQSQIFDQLMAIQNPALDRQQGQQQAREYAMGRGGVRGSQFGGTAEDAAMARARADAGNQAALSAMQQADSERSMFGQMASQYGQLGNQNYANQSNQMASLLNASSQQGQLGNQQYSNMADRENALSSNAAQFGQLGNQAFSNATQQGGMLGQIGSAMGQLGIDQSQLAYMPMKMQMELLNQSQGTGSMAQTGQLTGQDYLAQMLLGGTNANVNAQKVSSELMGNLYDSILDNLGSQNVDGSTSGLFGAFGDLGKLLGWGD